MKVLQQLKKNCDPDAMKYVNELLKWCDQNTETVNRNGHMLNLIKLRTSLTVSMFQKKKETTSLTDYLQEIK